MKKKEFCRAAIAVLAFVATTTAQDDCAGLAKYGIYDVFNQSSELQRTESFVNWFCQNQFSSYGEAKSEALKVGIVVEDLPIQLGYSKDDSQWDKWSSAFRQSQDPVKTCPSISNMMM